jgi:hypothetical protein
VPRIVLGDAFALLCFALLGFYVFPRGG